MDGGCWDVRYKLNPEMPKAKISLSARVIPCFPTGGVGDEVVRVGT